MNFNKVLLIYFFILFSCEPDDLCLETYPDTPKLIIKFFDNVSQESIVINNLTLGMKYRTFDMQVNVKISDILRTDLV